MITLWISVISEHVNKTVMTNWNRLYAAGPVAQNEYCIFISYVLKNCWIGLPVLKGLPASLLFLMILEKSYTFNFKGIKLMSWKEHITVTINEWVEGGRKEGRKEWMNE